MNWLRSHMRNHISEDQAVDPTKSISNILSLPDSSKNAEKKAGAAALDLVCQAAEIIRNVDDQSAERQARAERLARQATEELKVARARAMAEESKRRETEMELKTLIARVQGLEKAIEKATLIMAAAEARTVAAEKRADVAEKALRRIDNTISIQIFGKTPSHSRAAA